MTTASLSTPLLELPKQWSKVLVALFVYVCPIAVIPLCCSVALPPYPHCHHSLVIIAALLSMFVPLLSLHVGVRWLLFCHRCCSLIAVPSLSLFLCCLSTVSVKTFGPAIVSSKSFRPSPNTLPGIGHILPRNCTTPFSPSACFGSGVGRVCANIAMKTSTN